MEKEKVQNLVQSDLIDAISSSNAHPKDMAHIPAFEGLAQNGQGLEGLVCHPDPIAYARICREEVILARDFDDPNEQLL